HHRLAGRERVAVPEAAFLRAEIERDEARTLSGRVEVELHVVTRQQCVGEHELRIRSATDAERRRATDRGDATTAPAQLEAIDLEPGLLDPAQSRGESRLGCEAV